MPRDGRTKSIDALSWESLTCVHCGQKIVATRESVGFHWGQGKPWSEHTACAEAKRKAEKGK